jgi:hypothetical protein
MLKMMPSFNFGIDVSSILGFAELHKGEFDFTQTKNHLSGF